MSLRFLRKIKGKTKESARAVSRTLSIHAERGIICDEKRLVGG